MEDLNNACPSFLPQVLNPKICDVFFKIVESIALQETALAHILDAEANKINKVLGMEGASAEDIIAINQSVIGVLEAVDSLEGALVAKLNSLGLKPGECNCCGYKLRSNS